MAREGALKMKEISYIHAEAYPMGELKHGPLALIDEHVPTVGIVPSDDLFAKNAANLAEVSARNGPIILVSDDSGISELGEDGRGTRSSCRRPTRSSHPCCTRCRSSSWPTTRRC